MTHDELLDIIDYGEWMREDGKPFNALRAVVKLHKPDERGYCKECCGIEDQDGWIVKYPCPTIQGIEKELG